MTRDMDQVFVSEPLIPHPAKGVAIERVRQSLDVRGVSPGSPSVQKQGQTEISRESAVAITCRTN